MTDIQSKKGLRNILANDLKKPVRNIIPRNFESETTQTASYKWAIRRIYI